MRTQRSNDTQLLRMLCISRCTQIAIRFPRYVTVSRRVEAMHVTRVDRRRKQTELPMIHIRTRIRGSPIFSCICRVLWNFSTRANYPLMLTLIALCIIVIM